MGAKQHYIIIHILTSPEHCLNEFIATACTSIMRPQLPNAPNMQCPLIGLLPMSEATHYNTTQCIILSWHLVRAVPQVHTSVNTRQRQDIIIQLMPAKITSALLSQITCLNPSKDTKSASFFIRVPLVIRHNLHYPPCTQLTEYTTRFCVQAST